MRILVSALLGILLTVFAQSALAACRADALGTHRTITLDPKDHKIVFGDERSLGLRDREVILTFDDGPIGRKTSRVLQTLRNECVKATFFTVGVMAKNHHKLLRRILRDGHSLGHHTYGHNRLTQFSVKRAARLVDRGIATIEKIAYGDVADRPRVPFFRYPYLAHNRATDRMVTNRGLIIFDANIDSSDWKPGSSASAVHNRIMRRLRKERKGIILMHDIHNRTAKMLPRLLRTLKKEGYKIVHAVPKGVPPETQDPVVLATIEPDEARSGAEAHLPKPEEDAVFKLKADAKLDAAVSAPKLPKPTRVKLSRKSKSAQRTSPKISKRKSKRPSKKKIKKKSKSFVILGSNSSKITPPPVLKPVSSLAPAIIGKAFMASADEKPLITQSIPDVKKSRPATGVKLQNETPRSVAAKAKGWKLRSSHWILR